MDAEPRREIREPRVFTVRGRLGRYGPTQWNVEVENVREFRHWCDEIQRVTTRLNWFEPGPVMDTVSRGNLVERCHAAGEGALVEYDRTPEDWANGQRILRAVDLRVIGPAPGQVAPPA